MKNEIQSEKIVVLLLFCFVSIFWEYIGPTCPYYKLRCEKIFTPTNLTAYSL